jgi:hypothetical protein
MKPANWSRFRGVMYLRHRTVLDYVIPSCWIIRLLRAA